MKKMRVRSHSVLALGFLAAFCAFAGKAESMPRIGGQIAVLRGDIANLWGNLPRFSRDILRESTFVAQISQSSPISEAYESASGGVYFIVDVADYRPGSDNSRLYYISRPGTPPVLKLSGADSKNRILNIQFTAVAGKELLLVSRAVNDEIEPVSEVWSIHGDRIVFDGKRNISAIGRPSDVADCSDRDVSTHQSRRNITARTRSGRFYEVVSDHEAAEATKGLLGQPGIEIGCRRSVKGFLVWISAGPGSSSGLTFRVEKTGEMEPILGEYPEPATRHYLFFYELRSAGVVDYQIVRV